MSKIQDLPPAPPLFACRALTCDYQINGNPIDNPLRRYGSHNWTRKEERDVAPLDSRPAELNVRLGLDPLPPPEGLLYVKQANYALVPMFQKDGPRYLYSDSATSCIILIGTGMKHCRKVDRFHRRPGLPRLHPGLLQRCTR